MKTVSKSGKRIGISTIITPVIALLLLATIVLAFLYISGSDKPGIRLLFFAFFFPSFVAAAVFLIFLLITTLLPLGKVTRKTETLSDNQLSGFRIAISDFSRGNLTAKSQTGDGSLTLHASSEIKALVSIYNRMVTNLSEAIVDFNSVTSVPCRRICYVGADSYREGERCGHIMGGLLNGHGRVVILFNFYSVAAARLRRNAFTNVLMEKYPGITVVDAIEEREDPEIAYQATVDSLRKYGNIDGIYVCDGSIPHAVARAVKDEGKAGKIKIVCYDLTPATMEYVVQGTISATLSQNPYMQGHDPPIHLYNHYVTGEIPPINRIITLMEVITPQNYKEYWNPAGGAVLSEKARSMLAAPVKENIHDTIKIGLIVPEKAGFWSDVVKGTEDAAALMKSYNTDIQVIVPPEVEGTTWNVQAFILAIEDAIEKGMQALAMPILSTELIPYLNSVIDRGISIASLNGEPLNFRGIMTTIADHTRNLFVASENLSAGASESTQATAQISRTMSMILTEIGKQITLLSETDKILSGLYDSLRSFIDESSESIDSAKQTRQTAGDGMKTVEQSGQAMSVLKTISQETTMSIGNLRTSTMKIREVINIIDEITVRTNLLALNASIEAAHAGEKGKGFAVVAHEIRKLAEKSKEATGQIGVLLEKIFSGVEDSSNSVLRSIEEVNKNFELFNHVKTAFDNIMNASSQTVEKTEKMIDSLHEMGGIAENVRHSMQTLVGVNNDNNQAIKEITLSTKEMSLQVAEMSKTARLLSEMAQSEEDLILQLILDDKSKQA